jgi:hypothetical protein
MKKCIEKPAYNSNMYYHAKLHGWCHFHLKISQICHVYIMISMEFKAHIGSFAIDLSVKFH